MRPVGDHKRSADAAVTTGTSKQRSRRPGIRSVLTAAALVVTGLVAGGCDIKSFIDPSETFTNTAKPLQNPILDSISDIYPSVDDPTEKFLNAGDIRPEDLVVISSDYRIGKGDLISVTVNELVQTGVETSKQSRVSETGNITMPLIDQVHAEGLTEAGLQKAIAQAYADAKIINRAQVSVVVVEPRSRTFAALGAVVSAGEYQILKSDFKLLDAMVLIRDFTPTVDEIFVVRQVSEDPSSIRNSGNNPVTPTGNTESKPPTKPPTGKDPFSDAAPVRPIVPAKSDKPVLLDTAGGSGMTFTPGSEPSQTRVIRVPLAQLRNGDFRYNIVIRPHDLIIAPLPVTGEYYLSGHIARSGVYGLTDRKITLTQALAAAGNFDQLAIPERCELTRRVGPNRQVMVRLNADAILSGTQPDIFLKPNDVICIGTNILAPFIADVRNGFRITYGFGFLYDRNYAPVNNQN